MDKYKINDELEGNNLTNPNGDTEDPKHHEVLWGPSACRVFFLKSRIFNPLTARDRHFYRFLRGFMYAGQFWLLFGVSGLFIYNNVFNDIADDGTVF